ncbi:MAG: phosphoribosyl-ATP diphosphatase [Alphaproteobacteria bacterium]|nr:phosphoribosyl-ATP diphosphatase [Alphaproteobacteria bacterium]PHY01417.1 MAG: phosphoribosyl-ATP diphosphatase [Rhodospirillaceae bacterium]
MAATEKILLEMFDVIESRKTADPETSYTARLFGKGTQKIAQKFGEESIEVVVAAVSESQECLIRESADVIYHLLVLWADRGVKPTLVWEELEKRFGTSGLAVKEARKKSGG